MVHKKVYIILTALMLTITAGAQSFRLPGYQASVSVFDMKLIWAGVETSHGCQLNPHHYVGASLGLMLIPFSGGVFDALAHAEYKAYILDRKNTPMTGAKFGYTRSIGKSYMDSADAEVMLGWAFGHIELEAGARHYFADYDIEYIWPVMPTLTIAYAF